MARVADLDNSSSLPESPNINRAWALAVGSNAMQERVTSLLAYQKRMAKLPRRKPRNLAKHEIDPSSLGQELDSGLDQGDDDILTHGCTLQGLKVREGIEAYKADLEKVKKSHEQKSVGLETSCTAVWPLLELFMPHSKLPIRAVIPGWNPRSVAREMLYADGQKMTAVFSEHNAQKRVRNADRRNARKLLQTYGPPLISEYDYARHIARSEELSYEEWSKAQELKHDRAIERKRRILLEERKATEVKAKDPHPATEELLRTEKELVRRRLGEKAVVVAESRRRRMLRRWRRYRSFCAVTAMMFLRSWGMGILHKEQDALFIEPNLVLGDLALAENRPRLYELGITHMVIIGSFNIVEEGVECDDDFILCYVNVSGKKTEPQDHIKVEYEMGCRFIAGAHAIGGSVLVCCCDGINCAPALIAAYMLLKRNLCLKSTYHLLRLHEPDLEFSRESSTFI